MALFALGRAQSGEAAEEALGDELLRGLSEAGVLLSGEDGQVSTGGMILLPTLGHLVFTLAPSASPAVYVGDDSGAMGIRLTPRPGARCLDLCAGTGIQALRASAVGAHVVAVEILPLAAAVAELNFVLNGVEDRVEVRCGDLFGVLDDGERFDFVCAEPPIMPFPPDLAAPFVADGGEDGQAITRRVIEGLPEVLAAGGQAQVIGASLGHAQGPFGLDAIAAVAARGGLRAHLTIPARAPLSDGQPMLEWFVRSCSHAPGNETLTGDDVRQSLHRHLRSVGATHLYPWFLTATASAPRPGLTQTRLDADDAGTQRFWFR